MNLINNDSLSGYEPANVGSPKVARLFSPWRSCSISNTKPSAMASIMPSHTPHGGLHHGAKSDLFLVGDEDQSPLCHTPLFVLGLRFCFFVMRIMERISTCNEVGGAGGSSSYEALKKLDQLWSNICAPPPDKREVYEVISRISGPSSYNEVDKNNSKCMFHVVVCGGTLGIFIATALVSRGLRVGVVERNQLKGREQEWNISEKELMELIRIGILTKADIEQISTSKFNPNRCGFEKKGEIWVEDILNLGVSPAKLLETMKKRFLSLGGIVFEGKSLSSIHIFDDSAVLKLNDGDTLSAQLVVDSMGNFSPLVKQASFSICLKNSLN
ncbi:hypothetical protein M5K25_011986 [Dendrobium thyrsiflorum]|uniref:Uncharacterized protein n=1 Tax=Dendrobium thyrsiflorum TaxID=117978 RepID=A0ABD0V465_DENTH